MPLQNGVERGWYRTLTDSRLHSQNVWDVDNDSDGVLDSIWLDLADDAGDGLSSSLGRELYWPLRGRRDFLRDGQHHVSPTENWIAHDSGQSPIVPSEEDSIRRMIFDLIGTQPTASTIRSLIEDSRPDKYKRMVRDLRKTPQAAEKWARDWRAKQAVAFPTAPSTDVRIVSRIRQQFLSRLDQQLSCRPLDVLSYCPGLRTSTADVLHVLESEIKWPTPPTSGAIDPAARRLIDRARRGKWQVMAVKRGDQTTLVHVDAAGRYRYESLTDEGLRQLVVCDGTSLRHIYPELRVATQRDASYWHRTDWARRLPWLVPTADDLARDADVRYLGDHTVAVIPHPNKGNSSNVSSDAEAADHAEAHRIEQRYSFDKVGHLVERRWIDIQTQHTLLRLTIQPGGNLSWYNGKDKLLSQSETQMTDTGQPQLTPDLSQYVVVSAPIRSVEHLSSQRKPSRRGQNSYADWSEQDAVDMLAAAWAQPNAATVERIVGQRWRGRTAEARKLGYYAFLLSARHANHQVMSSRIDLGNDPSVRLDPQSEFSQEPLAQLVARVIDNQADDNPADSQLATPLYNQFFDELWQFHALNKRWAAAAGDGDLAAKGWMEDALQHARSCRSLRSAWILAGRLGQHAGDKDFHEALAGVHGRLLDMPHLGRVAEYERARQQLKSGQAKLARKSFAKWFRRTVDAKVLPLFDHSMVTAFRQTNAIEAWRKILRDATERLRKNQQDSAAIVLVRRTHEVGDTQLASELFGPIVDELKQNAEQSVALFSIENLWSIGRFTEADEILSGLLQQESLAEQPSLWLVAADLAERQGRLARQRRGLDQLEASLEGQVDLEVIRRHYSRWFDRIERFAHVVADPAMSSSRDFTAQLIAAADRWRHWEADVTVPCQRAAAVLRTLGADELAWDYLTTPLTDRPHESQPWMDLGKALAEQDELDQANRAFSAAFTAEPTNLQILWEHAEMRQQARQLYEQIAEGDWQVRFYPLKLKASQALAEPANRSG